MKRLEHFLRYLSTGLAGVLLLCAAAPVWQTNAQAFPVVPSAEVSYGCGYSQQTEALLADLSLDSWMGWVRRLSGTDSLEMGGQTYTITTRSSPALFNGASPAYDYVHETILNWYPAAQVEEDPYQPYSSGQETWKNLILTIPGTQFPDEIVILSAHLDSTSSTSVAPGADDNATGAAALLEAARVLQNHPLPRTIRLIWFTGEEQIMLGSKAYLSDPVHPERRNGIVGVVNLDMFGYDSDNDRCFELHVSANSSAAYAAPSGRVASCFAVSIQAYQIDLTYDYISSGATRSSDHSSFWDYGIGAVEVLENYFSNSLPNGCTGYDRNPNYHTANDLVDYINPQTAYDITRAGLATAFSLANPVPVYLTYFPLVKN